MSRAVAVIMGLLLLPRHPIEDLVFVPGSSVLVSCGSGGWVRFYDPSRGVLVRRRG